MWNPFEKQEEQKSQQPLTEKQERMKFLMDQVMELLPKQARFLIPGNILDSLSARFDDEAIDMLMDKFEGVIVYVRQGGDCPITPDEFSSLPE